MLLLLFVGLLLLRFAVRQLLALLFQLPPACRASLGAGRPRNTRLEPFGCHPKALPHTIHVIFI